MLSMSDKQIIEILKEQLKEQSRLFSQREQALMEQLHQQSIQLETLTTTVASLEKALLAKNGDIQSLANKNRGLGKLSATSQRK